MCVDCADIYILAVLIAVNVFIAHIQQQIRRGANAMKFIKMKKKQKLWRKRDKMNQTV